MHAIIYQAGHTDTFTMFSLIIIAQTEPTEPIRENKKQVFVQ